MHGVHNNKSFDLKKDAGLHSSFTDSDDVDWNEVEHEASSISLVADLIFDVNEVEELAFAEANDDITSVADTDEKPAMTNGSMPRRLSLDAMLGSAGETTPRKSATSLNVNVMSEASFADFGGAMSQSFSNASAVLSFQAAGSPSQPNLPSFAVETHASRPFGGTATEDLGASCDVHAHENVTTEARQPFFVSSCNEALCEGSPPCSPTQPQGPFWPPPPGEAPSTLLPLDPATSFKCMSPNVDSVTAAIPDPPSQRPLPLEFTTPESFLASPDVVFCGWSLKRGLFFFAQKFFVLTRAAQLQWFECTSHSDQIKHLGTINLSQGAAIQRVGGKNDYTFRLLAGGSTIYINPQTKDAYAMWQEGLVRSCDEGLISRRNVSRTAAGARLGR